MKRQHQYSLLIGFVLLQIGVLFFYISFIRPQVIALLEGKDFSIDFLQIVHHFYPRFLVERQRFEASFFVEKADQVIVRWLLVSSFFVVLWLLPNTHTIHRFFKLYWNLFVRRKTVKYILTAFFVSIVCYTHDWIEIIGQVRASQVYQSHLLWSWLPFPSELTVFLLYCAMILCSLFVILLMYINQHHLYRLITALSAIAVLLFVGLQLFYYSAEKIDHTYATLNYAAFFVPFLVYDYAKSIGKENMNAWAIQAIGLSIGIVYCMAGLEKLFISKLAWLEPTTLRSYLYLHPTSIGLWVAPYTVICQILSILVLLVQLGFIVGVLFRKYRFYAIVGGIAFHIGTFLMMGIGDYNTPWIFVYIFLLPEVFHKKSPVFIH
jgi:hypothetical protein